MSDYDWDADLERKYRLRLAVYLRFNAPSPVMHIAKLSRLLGYKTGTELKRHQSAEDDRKMRLLAGPYGPTIYKAMLMGVKKK